MEKPKSFLEYKHSRTCAVPLQTPNNLSILQTSYKREHATSSVFKCQYLGSRIIHNVASRSTKRVLNRKLLNNIDDDIILRKTWKLLNAQGIS